ncbi:glycerol-3-phosphate 1-O-acyltransferase PlsY [Sphingosinicella sp.]|uniref:glycerol-3-phosphate 1-O-acyltransferase PlsY n=1 Tax=Sphingosinicella sp. TaxID=1917971 RepID=UPI004037CB0A
MTFETLFPPLAAIVGGYLLGSIPFGLLLTRAAGLGDVRNIGSGNIGATNVLRTGRKGLAAATLLLDAAKGAAAVLLARLIWPELALDPLAGLAAFIGHLYPVWLRFRGGKGVATLLGVVAALAWPIGLIAALVWVLALLLTRYSSAGGMAAAVSAPIAAAAMGRFGLAPLFAGLALLVLWRHRENIARLWRGTEPKVGRSKAA